MNSISETLYYNQRIILSAPTKNPICWKITKVEQISPKGINHLTFYQDHYNQNTDAFEYEDGTISREYYSDNIIVGMYADYYSSDIVPEDNLQPKTYNAEISYAGTKAEIKIGGSYKKFSVTFEDDVFRPGTWSYYINGKQTQDIIESSTGLEENQIKVKFTDDIKDDYIGSVFTIKYTSIDGIETSQDMIMVSI